MPTTAQEDRDLLNHLVADPNPPRQVMDAVGINSDDLEAWKMASSDTENPLARKVENAVLLKIADGKPKVNEQAVDFSTRFVAKNLLDGRTDLVVPYLEKKGFDVRVVPGGPARTETRGSGSGPAAFQTKVQVKPSDQVQIRNPKTNQWGVLDPEGFNFWDILQDVTDVTGDVVEGVVTGAAAGAATAGTSLTGPGALGVGAAAGGAANALYEGGKQALAKGIGAREEFSGSDIAMKGTIGLAAPLLLGGGGLALRGAGKGASTVAKATGRAALRADSEAIEQAAKTIGGGAKATPGQLFASKAVQSREDDLVNQLRGSFLGGRGVRAQVETNIKAATDAADDVVKLATNKTPTEAGDAIVGSLKADVAAKLEPAIATYKLIDKKLGNTFAIKKPIREAIMAMKKEYAGVTEATSYLKQLEKGLGEVKTLKQLTNFRRSIGKTIARDDASFKGEIVDRLYGPITQARASSIKDPGARKALKEADALYAKVTEDVKQVLGSRSKKGATGAIEEFADKNVSSGVVNKILRTNDPKAIDKLAKEFPDAFQVARGRKIEEIAQRATSRAHGKMMPKKLAQIIGDLEPETAALLFDGEQLAKAKALKLFTESLPERLNPSGTSGGLLSMQTIHREFNALKKSFLQEIMANSQLRENFFNSVAAKLESPVATGAGVVGMRGLVPPTPRFLEHDNQGLRAPGGQ